MLRAYIDDSISRVGERRLVLAALIQSDATWSAFADDWRRTLAAPPVVTYLKMAEAQNRRGQFKGFSEKEAPPAEFSPASSACATDAEYDPNRFRRPESLAADRLARGKEPDDLRRRD